MNNSPKINQFGAYYKKIKAYSTHQKDECIDCYLSSIISNRRLQIVKEFIVEAWLWDKDIACKIIRKIKHNIDIPRLITKYRCRDKKMN